MSQQNSGTPTEFLAAVEAKFSVKLDFDLACTLDDCVVPKNPHDGRGYFVDKGVDALQQNWYELRAHAAWLNPPFKHIRPWVKKCHENRDLYDDADPENIVVVPGPRIFSLVPASVCSGWFADYVQGNAGIYYLRPRLVFIDPRTGYPFVNEKTGKPQTAINDCMLLDWGGPVVTECWKWK